MGIRVAVGVRVGSDFAVCVDALASSESRFGPSATAETMSRTREIPNTMALYFSILHRPRANPIITPTAMAINATTKINKLIIIRATHMCQLLQS